MRFTLYFRHLLYTFVSETQKQTSYYYDITPTIDTRDSKVTLKKHFTTCKIVQTNYFLGKRSVGTLVPPDLSMWKHHVESAMMPNHRTYYFHQCMKTSCHT